MDCPGCKLKKTFLLKRPTILGYKQFRCLDYRKDFNERTGTVFNYLRYPTDVVLLTVFLYYRYKLSLIDVTEHMALRGFSIDKEKALPKAIKKVFGLKIKHRTSKYKNNIIEQAHRGIKSRYCPMKGFKNIWNAMIFSTVFEELKNFFNFQNYTKAKKRRNFTFKIKNLLNLYNKTRVVA